MSIRQYILAGSVSAIALIFSSATLPDEAEASTAEVSANERPKRSANRAARQQARPAVRAARQQARQNRQNTTPRQTQANRPRRAERAAVAPERAQQRQAQRQARQQARQQAQIERVDRRERTLDRNPERRRSATVRRGTTRVQPATRSARRANRDRRTTTPVVVGTTTTRVRTGNGIRTVRRRVGNAGTAVTYRRGGTRADRRRDGRVRDGRRYNSHRQWNRRAWRASHRYNWNRYRNYNRGLFSLGSYYAPYRGYSYRRLSIGFFLDDLFFSSRYYINDPWRYRLPGVYGPYRWVRYYDDVVLVNTYDGRVVDVVYSFFW